MTPSPAALIAELRASLPAGIAIAGGAVGNATSSPFAEENAFLARAVDKRRREFVAGREYARAALAQLRIAPVALAILPSRAPQWPDGIVGSISHSGEFCAAAVAPASTWAGIGLDVESAEPLKQDLHATIATPAELAAAPCDAGVAAKLLFVAKEAFFKLYHPRTGHFIDFLDADVRLDPPAGTFELRLHDTAPALDGERTFAGVCRRVDDWCFGFVARRGKGGSTR